MSARYQCFELWDYFFLMNVPILVYPNFEKIFSLQTNALDFTLGAVLAQKNDLRRDQAVAYASRSMIKSERNYSHRKKCLGSQDV